MPKHSPLSLQGRWRRRLIAGSLVCALGLAFWAWHGQHSRQNPAPRPSASYTQALQQAQDGKPGAARLLYQQLARTDLADEQLIALLAELHNYPSPKALKLLDTHLNHESQPVRLAAIQAAGQLLPRSHLAVLLGPLLSDPDTQIRFETTLALARLSPDELGLYFAALQHSADTFQQSLASQTPDGINRLQLASLYRQTGDRALAMAALEQAIRLEPENLEAALAQVECFDDAGQPDKALQSLKSLLERHPDSALLQHALGKWLSEHGQAEYGMLSLARASELAPDNNPYRYDLAVALHSLDQSEAAQKQLAQILQNQPANRRARVLLIQYARESGQLQNVQVLLAELEQQNPDDPSLQQGL